MKTPRFSPLSRREVLRVGSLGLSGLSLADLLAMPRAAGAGLAGRSFGRARSVILLYMVGGPPQHETFDPKPEAASEVRGAFGAIPTPVPGLQVGELMPRLAKLADRYAVIRSMSTGIDAHTGSGYAVLTGRPHASSPNGESIPPSSSDWPTLASVMHRFLPGRGRDLPTVVVLPEMVKNNPAVIVAGQFAGILGVEHEPMFLECDPHLPTYQVPGLTPLADVGPARFERRRGLLATVNSATDDVLRSAMVAKIDSLIGQALDLLTSDRTRRAFDVKSEPPAVRERYGPHKYGQSCLLARRLVEAGVRLVTVNWPREPGDTLIGNPVWDTHSDNAGRLKSALMPPMDQGTSALLEDLETRGLLDETLVVWVGEFGRTPKHNPGGGRDHWGSVFCAMLAGGGIRGGVVHGSSDRIGAYPDADPVGPAELHATLYHCLGLAPNVEFTDRLNRPLRACEGEPIAPILL